MIRPALRIVLVLVLVLVLAALAAGPVAAADAPVVPGAASLSGDPVDPFIHLPWSATGARNRVSLGRHVAPAGDVNGDGYGDVLVAAPFDSLTLRAEGKVFLHLGSASGLSTVPAWTHAGGQAFGSLGEGLAPAGDINGDGYADVLIGAPNWDVAGQTDVGRVLVFHGGPSGLPAVPDRVIPAPLVQAELFFGGSLGTAGDVNGDGYADIVVGASTFNDAQAINRGSAWIWHGGPSGIPAAPARTLLGRPQPGAFGSAVGTAGDVNGDGYDDVIIGAPAEDVGFVNSGAVSLYLGSPGGIPASPDTTIGGMAIDASLGWSLTTLGDYIPDGYADFAAGEPGRTFDGQPARHGMVRRFYGGPGGVTTSDQTLGPIIEAEDRFGSTLATMGDVNGDGHPDYAVGSLDPPGNAGRVTLVLGDGGEGVYFGTTTSPVPTEGLFGGSLATSGDVDGDGRSEILVGDEGVPLGDEVFVGKAWLLAVPPAPPKAIFGWPKTGPAPGTRYGNAVTIVPRFFGDRPSVVIGDPEYQGTGRVSLHTASLTALSGVHSWEHVTSPGNFYGVGTRVVDAGDIDRDGRSDLAISAPTAGPLSAPGTPDAPAGITQIGRVTLARGTSGTPVYPTIVLNGASEFDRVGTALAGRGDVNGDGYHDLLVGAALWDAPGLHNAGKVWVLYGSPTGLESVSPWSATGTAIGQGLGASVAFVDFDGDGYSDVVASSVDPEDMIANGRVRVWFGGPSGPPANPGLVLDGRPATLTYGFAVAALGDVNGDAIGDLGVGAPDEGGTGRVYVYLGSRGRSQSNIADWTLKGFVPGGRFGEALAGGGDIDGDGLADFVVGAPSVDVVNPDEGVVYLFLGARPYPSHVPEWTAGSGVLGAKLGSSFAPLADLNEDGHADLVAGAPGAAGRVYAWFGHGGAGRFRRFRVQDEVGETVVPRFHPTRLAASQVRPEISLDFPSGPIAARLEFEAVTQNTPFTGVPTMQLPNDLAAGRPNQTSEIGWPLPWPGRGYYLRARLVSRSPYFPRTPWFTPEAHARGDLDFWTTGAVVGVGPSPPAGGPALIGRVAPNPARASGGEAAAAARIDYALPAAVAHVSIDVFGVDGRRVRRLFAGAAPAGPGSVRWDFRDEGGRADPPGVWFVELRADGRVDRAKVVQLP